MAHVLPVSHEDDVCTREQLGAQIADLKQQINHIRFLFVGFVGEMLEMIGEDVKLFENNGLNEQDLALWNEILEEALDTLQQG